MWIKVEAFCSEDLNQSEYEKGGKPPKVVTAFRILGPSKMHKHYTCGLCCQRNLVKIIPS